LGEHFIEPSGQTLVNTHPDYMNFDGGIRQRSDVTPVEHPGREPGSTGQGGQRSPVKFASLIFFEEFNRASRSQKSGRLEN